MVKEKDLDMTKMEMMIFEVVKARRSAYAGQLALSFPGGTVASVLNRLKKKGFLTAKEAPSLGEAGARIKWYSPTPFGLDIYAEHRAHIQRLHAIKHHHERRGY